ncbi:hypothetical protein, partial [Bacillus sp. WP8]|uniref:hypothetical protein n=1 Tax=Bacillus sp. WP8 TaxID=756828 RepID=UPI001C92C398
MKWEYEWVIDGKDGGLIFGIMAGLVWVGERKYGDAGVVEHVEGGWGERELWFGFVCYWVEIRA